MAIRITSNERKVGVVVAGYVGALLIALAAGAVVGGLSGPEAGVWTGLALALVLPVAVVLFCVRVFRGEGEDVAPPRPWWRLTARPTSGFVVGALFLVQAISGLARSLPESPLLLVPTAVVLVLGIGFVASSLRLLRRQDNARAG